MSMTLRDRRRRETARDIQLAALHVALRGGYAAVTTDAIAAEAGISPRTFFNYYCNKQAAILGQRPVLDCQSGQWFVTSDGPIIDDIVRLLEQVLNKDGLNRQVLQMILRVIEDTPELQDMLRQSMDEISMALTGLLEARLGDAHTSEARLLAELSTHALSEAVRSWAHDEAMSETDIPVMARYQLRRVGKLLC